MARTRKSVDPFAHMAGSPEGIKRALRGTTPRALAAARKRAAGTKKGRGRPAGHLNKKTRDANWEAFKGALAKDRLSRRGRKKGGRNRTSAERRAALRARIEARRQRRKEYAAHIKAHGKAPRGRKPRGAVAASKRVAKSRAKVPGRGRGRPKGSKDKQPRKRRGSGTTTPKLAKKAQAPVVKIASKPRSTNVRTIAHRTPSVKVGTVKAVKVRGGTGRGLRTSRA